MKAHGGAEKFKCRLWEYLPCAWNKLSKCRAASLSLSVLLCIANGHDHSQCTKKTCMLFFSSEEGWRTCPKMNAVHWNFCCLLKPFSLLINQKSSLGFQELRWHFVQPFDRQIKWLGENWAHRIKNSRVVSHMTGARNFEGLHDCSKYSCSLFLVNGVLNRGRTQ